MRLFFESLRTAIEGALIVSVFMIVVMIVVGGAFFAVLDTARNRVDGAVTSYNVTATWYTCSRSETDHDPNATASGYRCGDPIMAVSLDLLKHVPFGTAVRVLGRQYIVGDTMPGGPMLVDLPTKYKKDALKFGRRKVTMNVWR